MIAAVVSIVVIIATIQYNKSRVKGGKKSLFA